MNVMYYDMFCTECIHILNYDYIFSWFIPDVADMHLDPITVEPSQVSISKDQGANILKHGDQGNVIH